MIRLFIIITILATIAGCQPSSFTKEEQQAVADSVRQTLHRYYEDINRAGLVAELPYLDSSSEFFWVPPGYAAPISYDTVVKIIRQNALLFRNVNNVWDSLRINPLSKDLASYTGQLHSITTDTSGRISRYFLIETGLVIKRNDGWKLLNGQTAVSAQ
jgi:hypothetical protein